MPVDASDGRYYHDESYQCEDCEVPYPHLHILPMEAVLEFGSCDAYGKQCVLDVINRKREDDHKILTLMELISKEGFRPGYGIAVDRIQDTDYNYIHDGHHRLTVMYDLGAQWVPVQSSGTHWMDTPEYSSGKEARYEARMMRFEIVI